MLLEFQKIKVPIMKKFILLTVLISSLSTMKSFAFKIGVTILNYNTTSIKAELKAYFYFGWGVECKLFRGVNFKVQNDTMYCNAFYQFGLGAGALDCWCIDTITTPLPSGIHYFTVIGNYYIQYPTSGLYDTTWNQNDTTIILYPTNLQDRNVFEGINIYPNPTNGIFAIQSKNDIKNASVEVTDITGKCILQRRNIALDNFSINISAYPNGIYFLKMNVGDLDIRRKLVKR